MDRERFVRVFAGDHLDRPGVDADKHDLLVRPASRGGLADARLSAVVVRVLGRILQEQIVPAGVEGRPRRPRAA